MTASTPGCAGSDRIVYVFVPTTPPLCPVDGDEAPIVAEGVDVGSPTWYAAHDDLIAWATRVTICREAQRQAIEDIANARASARP